MALAFDAFGTGSTLPGNSITFSHTCTGSNRILIVGVTSNNNDVVTGATYNGVAMTLAKKSTFTGPAMYLFYLLAPATGANNVVVSATGGEFLRAVSVSYTGAQQSGQPDATTETGITTATSITTSLTQVIANAWQVGFLQYTGGGTVSAGSGIGAIRGNANSLDFIGDSNTTTSAGTRSMTWNNNSSAGQVALQFSLADITQPTTTQGAFLLALI